jgi:hypothetical protein
VCSGMVLFTVFFLYFRGNAVGVCIDYIQVTHTFLLIRIIDAFPLVRTQLLQLVDEHAALIDDRKRHVEAADAAPKPPAAAAKASHAVPPATPHAVRTAAGSLGSVSRNYVT